MAIDQFGSPYVGTSDFAQIEQAMRQQALAQQLAGAYGQMVNRRGGDFGNDLQSALYRQSNDAARRNMLMTDGPYGVERNKLNDAPNGGVLSRTIDNDPYRYGNMLDMRSAYLKGVEAMPGGGGQSKMPPGNAGLQQYASLPAQQYTSQAQPSQFGQPQQGMQPQQGTGHYGEPWKHPAWRQFQMHPEVRAGMDYLHSTINRVSGGGGAGGGMGQRRQATSPQPYGYGTPTA